MPRGRLDPPLASREATCVNATLFLCVITLACSGQASDTTMIVSDDPGLAAMANALLPEVSERAGMSLHEPVRIARRSREALETYLAFKLESDLPDERAEHVAAVYGLLGQGSPDLDLKALLASVYGEQVVGFYEPDSTALFLVDDQPEEAIEPILVHELVHAIQDQNRSLDSLTSEDLGNDAQIAAQAAIEGQATLVMMEWMFGRMGGQDVDFEDLPDFRGMVGPLLEGVRDQYPMLAGAPRVLQEGLLYPYIEGAGYVMEVWRSADGRPSPIGRHLPQSTEQVTNPRKILGAEPDTPVTIRFDASEVVYQNNLGHAELGVVLAEWAQDEAARALADGWAGDQYALTGRPGAWGLRWFVLWDGPEERDRMLRAWEGFTHRPGGLVATVAEQDGIPAIVFEVGDPPPLSVSAARAPGPWDQE